MENEKKNPSHWDYDPDLLGGFVPARTAMQMLNVKSTTLYNLRRNQKLVWSKIGSKIFYQIESIRKLLRGNQQGE